MSGCDCCVKAVCRGTLTPPGCDCLQAGFRETITKAGCD